MAIEIRARPATDREHACEHEGEGTPARERRSKEGRPSILGEALRTARSVLPFPSKRRATAPEWVLLLGAIFPALFSLSGFFSTHGSDLVFHTASGKASLWVLSFAYLSVVPFLLSSIMAFVASLAVGVLTGGAARSRVQEALVCPYCRDSVSREGTVVCARPRCGALYHRECWQECSEQYGGCAVYGCSSKKSREVTAAGYLLRVARLFLAALLFPPRVARALKTYEGEGILKAAWKEAAKITRGALPTLSKPMDLERWQLGLLYCVPLASVSGLAYSIRAAMGAFRAPWNDVPPYMNRYENPWLWVSLAGTFLSLPFLLPLIIFLCVSGAFSMLKGLANVLKGELAALVRADEGGTTVIGRLRLGLGKKT
ncbi:hypothetical protein HY251_20380 [bacterium]|nr:hypothetical protein [bacterium]